MRSPKSPVSDLPETPSIRNIKSMWEKGNVGGATESPKPMNKVKKERESGEGRGDMDEGERECVGGEGERGWGLREGKGEREKKGSR